MSLLALLGFAVIMGISSSTQAETLVDPTQPPSELGVVGTGGAQGQGEPVLQTVMLSATKKVAVINGQAVRVGEKFGDATLIRLTDHEAVLRDTDGTLQTLKMYTAVEKKVIPQSRGNKPGQRKTRRSINKSASGKP